jgi:myo-inositol 2-dehydrogenase/D-chiro-inositol 1-dehydrogenase
MLTIAVIGAGRIGAIHATNASRHPRAHLAWIVDPIESAARTLAAQTGAESTTDVAQVLADPAVDAIVIGSSTATHVPLIRAGIAAGKAVLCEKPVDLDLANARACLAEVGSEAPVMIAFQRRFDPTFAEIRQRLTKGEIGSIEQLTIISRDPTPPPLSYITGSGGLFRDMTIHDLDMARFFLGDIVSVQARGQNIVDPAIAEVGDIDAAVVTVTAASGAVGVIVNSRHCAVGYDQRLEAFGSKGFLAVDNQTATTVRSSTAAGADTTPRWLDFFLERYAGAYARELDAFVTAVEQGTGFSPTLADGVAALALAEAAAQSVLTGRAIVPSAV